MDEPNKNDLLDELEDDEFVMRIEEIKLSDKAQMLKPTKKALTVEDFEVLCFLGEGSYAKVIQVRQKATSRIYALKAILRKHMKKVSTSPFSRPLAKQRVSGQNRKRHVDKAGSPKYNKVEPRISG